MMRSPIPWGHGYANLFLGEEGSVKLVVFLSLTLDGVTHR
jgi:hypothetical protein